MTYILPLSFESSLRTEAAARQFVLKFVLHATESINSYRETLFGANAARRVRIQNGDSTIGALAWDHECRQCLKL